MEENKQNLLYMSIRKEKDLLGMKKISEVVAYTLKRMREETKPGMSTKDLDILGGKFLVKFGAKSAPKLTYRFPGWTCISLNNEIAHGIPSEKKIIKEGDLINIDVSAELNGYWSDNGGSYVVGQDIHNHKKLVDTSKNILYNAIHQIKGGVGIAAIGLFIETQAKTSGFKVIKNLTGHGIGKSLHEEPSEIANYYDRNNFKKFKTNSVVAIETFISTNSSYADTEKDGWTLIGNKGGFVAQHEHTIVVTNGAPLILTESNGIWND